jgi:hypothetical protein
LHGNLGVEQANVKLIVQSGMSSLDELGCDVRLERNIRLQATWNQVTEVQLDLTSISRGSKRYDPVVSTCTALGTSHTGNLQIHVNRDRNLWETNMLLSISLSCSFMVRITL